MPEPAIQIIYKGTPSVSHLPDCEKQSFFSALLAGMKYLAEEERKNAVLSR